MSETNSSCEASTEGESSTIYGILLVLGACVCYAIGNCLQRYSLLKKDGEKVFYILHKQVGWLLGMIIYFSANGLYAVALTFAPVSVLAAVFSLTIVANALCANFLLGDQVAMAAIPGYVMVLAGSVVFSVSVQAEVCDYDADGLIEVLTSGIAIIYWIFAGIFLIGGLAFAYTFESKFPYQAPSDDDEVATEEEPGVKEGNSNNEDPEQPPDFENEADYVRHNPSVASEAVEIPLSWNFGALVLYPATLGTLEAAGALLLNGINTLFTNLAKDDDEETSADDESHIGLWVGLYGVGIFIFLGIVLFLRLVYRRFEITAAFPTEFGVLTFASVVGGFLVFQDFKFLEGVYDVLLVLLASILILGGIAVVGFASWRKQQQMAADADAQKQEVDEQAGGDQPISSKISQGSSAQPEHVNTATYRLLYCVPGHQLKIAMYHNDFRTKELLGTQLAGRKNSWEQMTFWNTTDQLRGLISSKADSVAIMPSSTSSRGVGKYYVSITGLRLKSILYYFSFASHALPCFNEARATPGNVFTDAKTLDGIQHTLTAWESREAMVAFKMSETHKKAMRAFPSIATGKTYGYWADHIPDWEEAIDIWGKNGKEYGRPKE